MPRLAAIDLGSNTVRLLVAEADSRQGLHPVHAEQAVTRLGEGLARSRTLDPEAMARTVATIRAYRHRARSLGAERVLAVATAAVRDAENREDFLRRLAAEADVVARVVTGDEEARLTLLGVAAGLDASGAASGTAYCVLDIGGGSTELVVARGALYVCAVSLRLGVVPLVERFLHADPVDWAEYSACARHVAAELARDAWPEILRLVPRTLVGTAGTVTTLAALDLGLTQYDPARVHGHRLSRERIATLRDQLGALHVAERARLPGLEPGRADLIVPGVAVTLGVMDGLGLGGLTVSDTGLREGILLEAAGWALPA